MSPADDQQLDGLIMWMVGGIVPLFLKVTEKE
jgi:hypothetical protein